MTWLLVLVAAFVSLISSSSAFLYGRSSIVEPPVPGALRSFAVVNASSRIAVSINSESRSIFLHEPLYMTLTLPFYGDNSTSGKEPYFLTRRLPEFVQEALYLSSSDIFVSDDQQLLWIRLQSSDVVTISLNDCSLVSSFYLSMPSMYFLRWEVSTHANGASFALGHFHNAEGLTAFLWQLPNSNLASSFFTTLTAPARYFLAGSISGSTPLLYVVYYQRNSTAISIYASRVNLTDATRLSAPPVTIPNNVMFGLSSCSFALDLGNSSAAVVFLAFWNDTHACMLYVDSVTLITSVTFITANRSDIAFEYLRCGVTATPFQYIVWEDTDVPRATSIQFLFLDLTKSSLTSLAVPHTEGQFLLSAKTTPAGDLVISACDSSYALSDNVRECAYYYFDAFVAADQVKPSDIVHIGTMEPTFGAAVEHNGMVAVLLGNLISAPLISGIIVYNASTPERIEAYMGLNGYEADLELTTDAITMDDQFRVFTVAPIWQASPLLWAFDWRTPATALPLGSVYNVEYLTAPVIRVEELYIMEGTLVILNTITFMGSAAIARVSIPDFTLLSYFAPSDFVVRRLAAVGTSQAVAVGEDALYLLNRTLNGVISTWPLDLNGTDAVITLGVVVSSNLSTVYAYFDAGDDEVACAQLSLASSNSSLVLRKASVPTWSISLHTAFALVGDYIYVAVELYPTSILRYDLDCNLEDVYSTGVNGDLRAIPKYFYGDEFYIGRAPIFTSIYLDCGPGAFRNVSSGSCAACPPGSASALADTQSCQSCPTRTMPSITRTACVCAAGFYSPTNDANCFDCPQGGVCLGNNRLIPQSHYWRANLSSDYFYSCPLPDACNGSDVCVQGYTGPLCAVCAPHHALVINECRLCTSSAAVIGFWILAALIYVAIFFALLYSADSSFSVLKSFISFAQIVTFPSSGPVPLLLRDKLVFISRLFSLANLQVLSLVSPDCLLGHHVAYPISVVVSAAIPVLLILLIILLFRLPWPRLYSRLCSRKAAAADLFNEDSMGFGDRLDLYARTGTPLRVAIFIMLLTSPASTQQLASFFTCRSVAGFMYLVRDYAVQCYDGVWAVFVAPVSILFTLYALGVPLGFFALLYRYRQQLDLRVLHGSYKDNYYWWDCFEQLRKISLLLCNAVLEPRAPGFFGPSSLIISIFALYMHCLCSPYKSAVNFWFQSADLVGVCLFFLWFVSNDLSSADVLAWVYWLFAMSYGLASMCVLVYPLVAKLFRSMAQRWKCSDITATTDSELDPLFPKAKQ